MPDKHEIVAAITRSAAHHAHFFHNADDPAWLPFLAEHGFFKQPTPPVRGEDWVRYPNWPESQFLVRVAARAPDAVFEIARGVHKTDNPRVHEDILRIATQLPGPQAAELARDQGRWLREYDGHLMSLPRAAGELIVHLAEEGEARAALRFAGSLLRIVPGREGASSRRRAQARMNEYEYRQILETAFPAIREHESERAFAFLCHRLAEVVRIGFIEDSGLDSTYIWRPAVESHEQNLNGSLLDVLVNAVRDEAERLSSDRLTFVLETLAKHEAPIFARLRLHVLRTRGPAELVAGALVDRELARDSVFWHEYGELLRARFSDLDASNRQQVLELIAAGPGVELTPELRERGVTEEAVERNAAHWRLRWYEVIADHLDADACTAYEALRAELGQPSHPTFRTYSSTWVGPTSPYTVDELRELGPQGVAQRLREWEPAGGQEDPSPDGLARILELAVSDDPSGYAENAAEFEGQAGPYIRGVLGGLDDAARKGAAFDWGPVLALCATAVETPGDASTARWIRREVASLLLNGLASGAAEIPAAERERVWSLLERLGEDPDPDPQPEPGGELDDSRLDPATEAINTVRGEAISAVLGYIQWIERTAGLDGMASVPEARELLERRVDPEVDRAPAVRAVYGRWFPQLVRIDPAWAESVAERVFPPDEPTLFAAAWESYVIFNRAYSEVFAILREAYAAAVERVEPDGPENTPLNEDPRECLGNHVFSMRILDHDDALFEAFWSRATTGVRREVLLHVGGSLAQTSDLEGEVAAHARATWEWVLEQTREDDPEALAGFGAWVEATQLGIPWLLAQAQEVLARRIHLEPDHVVYEAAPQLVKEEPAATVRMLRGMVESDEEGWTYHGYEASIRQALRTASEADDANAQAEATRLIELFAARGVRIAG